ncbi:class I SAM-dependent methyltransferase [Amycolatopsis sp. NPDC023774]|uniref:class I SAM-dependent methyltransferase n=1 Tax=Amycolatopsis sp. NPDC023774 TaxID=3155015 RepID=UPI0033D5AF45
MTETPAFAERMKTMLNEACLALQVSVGHQTGLFDVLAGLAPSTSEQIAGAAALNERYVREWLAAMTVGGIVAYDPETRRYTLPAEHAASLTRAAGLGNQASMLQYLAMMGDVEQQVVAAFKDGSGVPYSAYPRFQKLQGEESARTFDAELLTTVLPLAPGLEERLTRGIAALDVGTGQGHAVNLLARAFPASTFTGVDVSEAGIAAAREEARAWGLTNASFAVSDATGLEGEYDLVTTFDVIHDSAAPDDVLAAVHRVLRPGGTYLMQDTACSTRLEDNIAHPLAPALYTFSVFYCMSVSLAQGGVGLGTMWGEQDALARLAKAGFTDVTTGKRPDDVMDLYYVARKPA